MCIGDQNWRFSNCAQKYLQIISLILSLTLIIEVHHDYWWVSTAIQPKSANVHKKSDQKAFSKIFFFLIELFLKDFFVKEKREFALVFDLNKVQPFAFGKAIMGSLKEM